MCKVSEANGTNNKPSDSDLAAMLYCPLRHKIYGKGSIAEYEIGQECFDVYFGKDFECVTQVKHSRIGVKKGWRLDLVSLSKFKDRELAQRIHGAISAMPASMMG